MAWRAAGSLITLHHQLKTGAPRAAPPATRADEWGLLGDAAHDPESDHTPHDLKGLGAEVVTAADFPNRPDLGLDAHQVLDDIRRSRDARVKYGISDGQMFSSYPAHGYAAWQWRPYNPKNGDRHFTHGHLSVVGDARADGTQPWQTIGATAPASTEDDDMGTWHTGGDDPAKPWAITQNAGRNYLSGQQRDTVLAIAAGGAADGLAVTQQVLALLQAVATKVDIDPAELAAIQDAARTGAKTGAAEALVAQQQSLIDGIVAALPPDKDGTLTVDDVRATLIDVLLHGADS